MISLDFDRYTLQARLAPVLVLLTPVGLVTAAWFPEQHTNWGLISGAFLTMLITVLLSQVGRDAGKRKEPGLYARWGGSPTTRRLRHAEAENSILLKRCHARLAALAPDVKIPSRRAEKGNPEEADQSYEALVLQLREITRDRKKFPLVFAENVSYGFRRNLWAMRPAGIVLAAIGIVGCLAPAIIEWWQGQAIRMPSILLAVANIILMTLWCLRFTTGWVKLAADAYAERLLGACYQLEIEELKVTAVAKP